MSLEEQSLFDQYRFMSKSDPTANSLGIVSGVRLAAHPVGGGRAAVLTGDCLAARRDAPTRRRR